MERLGIPHVSYKVTWVNEMPFSVCEDFITRETELVPAWRIIQTQKKKNDVSVYLHFVNFADGLGIPDVIPFLDRVIILDYLIANEDRHFNNFGVVRDAETLKWLGMAPIYDSGSSLGYDKVAAEIRRDLNTPCKLFKNHHEEQLKLVTDFSWIDFSRLSGIREWIIETLSSDSAAEYIGESRIRRIAETVQNRIVRVRELSVTRRTVRADTTRDDVERNTSATYASQMNR